MLSLSALPAELLLLIAGHLNSKDTLYLASCCQRFHPLLLPQVFSSLDLDISTLHLKGLIHTLTLDPNCANATRRLEINSVYRDPPHDIECDYTMILPFLKQATSSSAELAQWEDDLRGESDRYDRGHIWVSMLLFLLPNLDTFVMEMPSFYIPMIVTRITRGPTPTALSRLRELDVKYWHTKGGLGSSYIMPFFRLPSLRKVSGRRVWDGDSIEGIPSNEDYTGVSNVTHMNFECSNSPLGCPDMISASKALKSFIYKHGDCVGDAALEPAQFYKSLCKHRDTLEEITVCCAVEYMTEDPVEDEFMGSFLDFKVLKKLRVRALNLTDLDDRVILANVLPATLESLVIEDIDDCNTLDFIHSLEDLVRGSHCPGLVNLEVKGIIDMPREDPPSLSGGLGVNDPLPITWIIKPKYTEMTANLEKFCQNAGIRFRLRDAFAEYI
ncbi:hypothetical protein BJX99DRAFT_253997 [Aspergillus californicus]